MYKKVQIVVLNSQAEKHCALLLKTNAQSGSFWQNITGSVEQGENSEEAAKRELFEEAGLHPCHLKKLSLKFSFTDRHQRQVEEDVFLALIDHSPTNPPIKLSLEHIEYKWKDINDIQPDDYYYSTNYEAFLVAKKEAQLIE